MMVLRKFRQSRKAWLTFVSLVVYVLGRFGLDMDPVDVYTLVGILMTLVVGQGIADSSTAQHTPSNEEVEILNTVQRLSKKGLRFQEVVDIGERVAAVGAASTLVKPTEEDISRVSGA